MRHIWILPSVVIHLCSLFGYSNQCTVTTQSIVYNYQGENTTLLCQYEDCNAPVLTWYNGTRADGDVILTFVSGEPNIEGEYIDRFSLVDDAHLFIIYLRISDENVYTCDITALGDGDASEVFLNVSESIKPDILYLNATDDSVPVSDNVTFICYASGQPTPYYTWFKDDQKIDHDKYCVNDNFTVLTISADSVDYAGDYTCQAENFAGSDNASIGLTVYDGTSCRDSSFVVVSTMIIISTIMGSVEN